jgi:hypothetical protein
MTRTAAGLVLLVVAVTVQDIHGGLPKIECVGFHI